MRNANGQASAKQKDETYAINEGKLWREDRECE
jgi:hypothetical protein